MTKRTLITGASGLVGTRLTEILLEQGREVVHLGRTRHAGKVPSFSWDIAKGSIDTRALEGVGSIIHLAGAGIADKRWTKARKQEIIDSRVQSTKLLHRTLKTTGHQVESFISASGIGYYGPGDASQLFTELSPPGIDFLAHVTQAWEESSKGIEALGVRVVRLRTGVVLSERGGVLKAMAAPVKLGVGAALGSGKQFLSWIHLDDLCGQYIKSVDDRSLRGPYNSVGTKPVTNLELTKAIARVLDRPLWLPSIPAFVLKLIVGELAEAVVTGSKVSTEKMLEAGYKFQFEDLDKTLGNLFKK